MSYNVEVTVGGAPYYKLFKRGSRGDGVYALTSRLSEMGYPVSRRIITATAWRRPCACSSPPTA